MSALQFQLSLPLRDTPQLKQGNSRYTWRFTLHNESKNSHKFWQWEQNPQQPKEGTLTFGRMGTTGRRELRDFQYFFSKVTEKIKKGYVLSIPVNLPDEFRPFHGIKEFHLIGKQYVGLDSRGNPLGLNMNCLEDICEYILTQNYQVVNNHLNLKV